MAKANNNWSTATGAVSPKLLEKQAKPQTASKQQIPWIITTWHIYIEPFAVFSGVFQLYFLPDVYFNFMPPPAAYTPSSRLVCIQLASAYLLLFVIEVLVLRVAREDIKIWRAVLFAILLCDTGHAAASWIEMGTKTFWSPWLWTAGDFVTMIWTIPPLLLRAAFLAGVPMK